MKPPSHRSGELTSARSVDAIARPSTGNVLGIYPTTLMGGNQVAAVHEYRRANVALR
ncbi:MAG: hypothetical protein ABL955_13620 [Elusimicrobiota bacterium]